MLNRFVDLLSILLTAAFSWVVQVMLWNVSEVKEPDTIFILSTVFAVLPLSYLLVKKLKDSTAVYSPAMLFLTICWSLHVATSCAIDSGTMIGYDFSFIGALILLLPLAVLVTYLKNTFVTSAQCFRLAWKWLLISIVSSLAYHFGPLSALAFGGSLIWAFCAQWAIICATFAGGWFIHKQERKRVAKDKISKISEFSRLSPMV